MVQTKFLIVPIDFPDFPGGAGLTEQLEYDKKWINQLV
jgi:hypothetical protein